MSDIIYQCLTCGRQTKKRPDMRDFGTVHTIGGKVSHTDGYCPNCGNTRFILIRNGTIAGSLLRLSASWKMTATEKGTRTLGEFVEVMSRAEKHYFRGYPILKKGNIACQLEGHNMIVTDGLEFITNMLIDTSAVYDTGITYCAEGTDNTAVSAGQTDLIAETARKTITSRTISGVEGTFSTFFTAAEANDAIEEAGLFGGSGAGAGSGSGVMFARWLLSFDNSGAAYDITIDYVLTPAYS